MKFFIILVVGGEGGTKCILMKFFVFCNLFYTTTHVICNSKIVACDRTPYNLFYTTTHVDMQLKNSCM